MVFEVPRHAVDLVNDDVADVARLAQVGKKPLERGAIGAPCRFTGVDVLARELPALLLEQSQACLPLRGDRVTLLGQILLDLLGRGDSEVDVRAHRSHLTLAPIKPRSKPICLSRTRIAVLDTPKWFASCARSGA